MNDIRGVEIQRGDTVFYVSHDDGVFREAIVVGFTPTKVRLSTHSGFYNTIKDPKFIVVK